jgi:alkylation response protein AidB-like acyl-CoA dehydrogenase
VDFQLSEDQLLMKQTAREFCQKRVRPHAEEFDRQGGFPRELIEELASLGYLGLLIPEAYGGLGIDTVSYVCVMEEFAQACASLQIMVSVHNSLVCQAVASFGSEALKKRFLPKLASGEHLGAYCLSEPGAGTDAGALITTARREGDYFVCNGTKSWVTNGGLAQVYLVFARTDPAAGKKGISCLLVESGTPGLSTGKPEDKLGLKASDTREVSLADARIPADQVVGEEGRGLAVALSILDSGRIGVAAQSVGIAQAALDEALKYAQEREQFGKPIAEFQAIQFKLADMATRVDASRLLTYRAAYLKDQAGGRASKEISMAKLFASESANWVANEAVQIHGGYGYIKEYAVERYFRDARVTEIYEGTSEAQRMVISRDLLGKGIA